VPKDNSSEASESGTHKQKRKKEKMIRLDDLLPKGDVTGGRRLLFGASDTQQTTQENKD
jgi:hypothetical protein